VDETAAMLSETSERLDRTMDELRAVRNVRAAMELARTAAVAEAALLRGDLNEIAKLATRSTVPPQNIQRPPLVRDLHVGVKA
jgi:small-conductance mechanosensitive channel